jgi:hypothetical protein
MRVSFDSNAWETIFGPGDTFCAPVRAALHAGRVAGFICEAAFRIEAITKRDRAGYFGQPYLVVQTHIEIVGPKLFTLAMSVGPDDRKHPGLPHVQAEKLARAFAAGLKLMDGQNWMGLPRPPEVRSRTHFVSETDIVRHERQRKQIDVFAAIEARGVGKAIFDTADGWTDRPRSTVDEKQLIRACAEWADAELVGAHIAYQNDILCTNDMASRPGRSIFDATSRAWLAADFGITFMTVSELIAAVKA